MASADVDAKVALNTDTLSTENSEQQTANNSGLSKRKQKRLARLQRKDVFKKERRLQEREKKKERRRQKIMAGGPDAVPGRKQLKRNTMATSSCKLRVAIDCSYDSLMADKDVKDLGGQVARCYSINRRLANPIQYYIVTANGRNSSATKARLAVLNCTGGWDVHLVPGDEASDAVKDEATGPSSAILSAFNKEEIVYLTSESPNVLETLDDSKVYIIGGLVDHNTHKGLTMRLATEMGVAHAKLPIEQYVRMLYRKVLTVCHVFEILVKYSECHDWQQAFLNAIPKRHNVEPIEPVASSKLEQSSPVKTAAKRRNVEPVVSIKLEQSSPTKTTDLNDASKSGASSSTAQETS